MPTKKLNKVENIDKNLYKNLDVPFYRNNNPDIKHFTDSELILHYVNYGKKEGRIACNIMNKSNIIVIDILFMQGGSYVVLQLLIAAYKSSVNFIIIRQMSESLTYVSLNDDEMLETSIDINKIPNYIRSTESKIMFINSLATQNAKFVNMLYTLDIYKVGITHDFSILYNVPQPCDPTTVIRLRDEKFYNLIISQHDINCELMQIKNAIICELPDYCDRKNKINTSNYTINIAVIGNASHIKGSEFYATLLESINCSILLKSKYKFRIFGTVNLDVLKTASYPYNDINCLNDHLIDYKPNVIIEASIWPETWSLSLSLSKIIGVPILYRNKPFRSVVVDRLKNYDNAHSFENITECFGLIDKCNQDYFYTIDENKIKIPYFYESLFQNKYTENLIIITLSQKENNQTPNNYSNNQRLDKTLKTIKSIKKYFKSKYLNILIVDNSTFDSNQFSILSKEVDFFISRDNVENTKKVEGIKGLFEVAQLNYALDFIKNNNLSFKNLFKISDRFLLDDSFVFETFNNNKNNFQVVKDRYSTSLFKISFNYFTEFRSAINLLLRNKSTLCDKDVFGYEKQFSNAINRFASVESFKNVTNLGITSNV